MASAGTVWSPCYVDVVEFGSDSAAVDDGASSFEFRVPQNNSLMQHKCGGSSQLDIFVILPWAGSSRMHILAFELSQPWLLPALVDFIDGRPTGPVIRHTNGTVWSPCTGTWMYSSSTCTVSAPASQHGCPCSSAGSGD